MRPGARWPLAGLLCLALTARGEVRQGVMAEVELVGGVRGVAGSDDAMLGGAGVAVAYRRDLWRFGVAADLLASRAFWHAAVDAGLFAAFDVVSVAVDDALTAAFFVRLDAQARFVLASGQVGFFPSVAAGVHVAGLWISLAWGPDFFLRLPEGAGWRCNWGLKVGLDFVELAHFLSRLDEEKWPLPP